MIESDETKLASDDDENFSIAEKLNEEEDILEKWNGDNHQPPVPIREWTWDEQKTAEQEATESPNLEENLASVTLTTAENHQDERQDTEKNDEKMVGN